MAIEVKVKDNIYKPTEEVFDAIVNPSKIVGYFVSSTSNKIEEGKTIIWEFKDYNVSIEVKVLKVIPQKHISFEWSASGNAALVTIDLVKESESKTSIEIIEKQLSPTEDEVAKALGQTGGWTDFICSLKAYLYTGINLRTGKYN
jgi:uncharacterized protein YndB with AHSA1/START domain